MSGRTIERFGFIVLTSIVCAATAFNSRGPEREAPPDHRFFLHQIFDKYGDNGIITFEGFEHLLENLGLGHLSFDKEHNVSLHRINGSFQDVHDALNLHDHHHGVKAAGIERDYPVSSQETAHLNKVDEVLAEEGLTGSMNEDFEGRIAKRSTADDSRNETEDPKAGLCLSPQAILQTFGLKPNHSVAISPARFLHLCPAIVYQLDRRTCSLQVSPVANSGEPGQRNVTRARALLYATISTAVISSVGLLAVSMVPLARRRTFLHFLIAIAVGTLAGDALLHMLPHALLSEENDHETIALRCSATFFAVVFFYVIESSLLLVKSSQEKKLSKVDNGITVEMTTPCRRTDDSEAVKETEVGPMLSNHGHSHGVPSGSSSTLTFLVLIGDGLHNFTDGLAIGASFAIDPVGGLATTIAVFCHELPHELGDFAVLLNAGMSVRRALFYNLVSSFLSFLGAGLGVWLGEFQNATHWIYATTAGTFLYIALADLIPEMMSYVKNDGKVQGIIIQVAGITTGGIIMLLIAMHEDKLYYLFT